MNNLSFQSILNEAYIPWSRLAGGLLKNLSGLQIEEPLVKEFKKLSDQLGPSVFVFDPLTKNIKVIDWTKMSKESIETVLRSSRVRTELLEILTLNNIDITKPAVRSTLTGIYRVLGDAFANSNKKVVSSDWTTSTVVKNFLDGMKLSAVEFLQHIPLVKKLVKDTHLKFIKKQEEIEREVIRITNEIVKKRKDPLGVQKEFDELNKLFEQMTTLSKQENKIIWEELEKRLPPQFMQYYKTNKWNDERYKSFIKYFQGELKNPPKVVFEKIEAAKKLLPSQILKKGNQGGRRILNTLLLWEPRTREEVQQMIRLYGGAKFAGKTITDKVLFALVVYPSITASIKAVVDGVENAMGVDLPIASGNDFKQYFDVGDKKTIWANNLLNLVPNTLANYFNSFDTASSSLRTLPGWSPMLALFNIKDFAKKSPEEKIKILKNTNEQLEKNKTIQKEEVKKEFDNPDVLNKIEDTIGTNWEQVTKSSIDSIVNKIQNLNKTSETPKPKPKFDSNF
jgi:hypothetical protein